MPELVVNIHIHTRYSDGTGFHADVAKAALRAGLDAIIITDHNVWVDGLDGYHQDDGRRVLVLVGEEVHDRSRVETKNHLLVFGAGRELSSYAPEPQRLIDQANQSGALTFIAHPIDPALPLFGEGDISWVDWQVSDFTGLELWNGFSELKAVTKNLPQALFYAFYPQFIPHGPLKQTLAIWDELTCAGKRVVAIGGSDAHALSKHMGPLSRTIFPYEYHFQTVNVHLVVPNALTGSLPTDRQMILDALRSGHAFIANDRLHSARGFRFTASGKDCTAEMGDEVQARGGVTLQVHLPAPADGVLLKDGKPIRTWRNRQNTAHIVTEPGVYRVEAYRSPWGRKRGWIFTNPIYVRP
ncbi:MAG TPA: CehA/McbA family metallohydrolase [Anaerolineaceae bacterium]|nr:CehA/McbA family metallohydrolase [Anaerolineaceae bacterium]